jgi:glyoxylase-like metal-dependent hydrolase (beta-lactamase superfamily II)
MPVPGILNILKHTLLSAAVLLLTLLSFPASSQQYGQIANPEYAPDDWGLPATAINSDQVPSMKIDPKAADDRPLPVYKIAEDTYMLLGNISTLNDNNRGWNGNAGFIVTSEGVLVIDTLGTPKLGRRVIATIHSLTDKPIRYLVVTHNHPDHSYGAAAFASIEGVTVIAHRGSIQYNLSATLDSSVQYRRELLPEDMQGFKPVEADTYIDIEPFKSHRIELGDAVFEIYNTGSHHSHGDLVVHQLKQDVVWISDLAFNQRTTFLGDGHSHQIIIAQDWLLKNFSTAKLMVPGHGSAQTAPFPMVGKTRDYVQRLRDAMAKAVDQGVDMYDAVQGVEFSDWKGTHLYEENQRANANFIYREMEQALFE